MAETKRTTGVRFWVRKELLHVQGRKRPTEWNESQLPQGNVEEIGQDHIILGPVDRHIFALHTKSNESQWKP